MNINGNNTPYQLTKEQLEKAISWLESKKKNLQCEVCGKSEWQFYDSLVAQLHISGDSISIPGELIPQFSIICTNCGNTKFFDAIMCGIVDVNLEKVD